jgi:hypothetical protein
MTHGGTYPRLFPWSALSDPLFLPLASLRRQGYPLNPIKDS